MTTAIVVARGGSVRLPNKALLPFAGTTLIGHKVRTLKACRAIDRVVVGSDSMNILDAAEAEGAEIVLRDHYHCDEARCSANEMIADMAGRVEGDLIVWAHPTNPLVRSATYDAAVGMYREAIYKGHDSLASVYSVKRHAWASNGAPLNFNPWAGPHRLASELEPIRFQCGSIFIQPRQQMLENRYFYGRRPALFEMPADEHLDIDVRHDYETAVLLSGTAATRPVA
jgi:CMP-N,N'-diacetyllegionaminic acid synthase